MSKENTDINMRELFDTYNFNITEEDKEHKTFKKIISSLFKFLIVSVVMGIVVSFFPLMGTSIAVKGAQPALDVWNKIPDTLPPIAIAQHNKFYDKNGSVFAEIWNEDRVELNNLDQISGYAKNGLIDTEDKRFYENAGFDFKGTIRSALTGSGGGSGITQQLVKNMQFYNLLGKGNKSAATEQTLSRKVKELKISINYEKTHSKDQILLEYFNTVAFGAPNIYGIQTASKYFFNKDAKDLSLAESALLIGTTNNPSIYNLDNPNMLEVSKKREKIVLDRLLAEKHISKEDYDKAINEEIKFNKQPKTSGTCKSSKYPYYCDYVLNSLYSSSRLGNSESEREAIIDKGGLQIYTYLDPQVLEAMNSELSNSFGNNNRVVTPSALVQPGTGGVIAFAQNRDYGDGDGKTELNTPDIPSGEGSTYKMFTLAAALNSGMTEKDLTFSSQCPLYPGNGYDAPNGGFQNSQSCALQGGLLNYKQATAYSSNTWFVTLEMKITVEKVKEFSKSVGLRAPDTINNASLAYTLGSVENSPINVAAAFATFANKGVYCPPTPISSMKYSDGSDIAIPDGYDPAVDSCKAVMSPQNAGIVLKAMRANVSGEIPNAFGVKAKIDGYDTVGKSGTNELLNSTWEQLSSQYSLFVNTYDMNTPSNGINNVMFRGANRQWFDNVSEVVGADMLRNILKGKQNVSLDYDDPNTNFSKVVVNESNFFTMPSVVGMEPAQAVQTLQNLGMTVKVSKDYKPLPSGYSDGVIVEQSIDAGSKLSKGNNNREITLYIGKG